MVGFFQMGREEKNLDKALNTNTTAYDTMDI